MCALKSAVCAVFVKEIVLTNKGTYCAGTIFKVVFANLVAMCADTLCPLVLALKSAICADSACKAVVTMEVTYRAHTIFVDMLYLCSANSADSICGVFCVLAGSRCVIKCECIVSVVDKGKCDFSALRNKKFISLILKNICVIKNCKIYVVAGIAVCFVETLVVPVFKRYIAVFCEGGNKLSVLKLVDTDVINILAVAVILTVDEAVEIERSSLL